MDQRGVWHVAPADGAALHRFPSSHRSGALSRPECGRDWPELGADAAAVDEAYRRLIKQHHPDREGGDSTRAAEINRAYRELRGGKAATDPLQFNDGPTLGLLGIHNIGVFGPETSPIGLAINLAFAAILWLGFNRVRSVKAVA